MYELSNSMTVNINKNASPRATFADFIIPVDHDSVELLDVGINGRPSLSGDTPGPDLDMLLFLHR